MFSWALQSLEGLPPHRLVFVALAEHVERFGAKEVIEQYAPGAEVVAIDDVTEGQLCTVLAAGSVLETDAPILVASSDTWVDSDIGRHIEECDPECRGLISVADLPGDRWSFARVGEDGGVVEVAEKRRISRHASTGLYYFGSGREFIEVAQEIIRREEKVRGEYYVIPVYQDYVLRGLRVELSLARKVYDMGTPDALTEFERAFPRD